MASNPGSDLVRRIVLGVTGSISAPKSQRLVGLLRRKLGWEVRVCMTRAAQQFIGVRALSGMLVEPPYTDVWEPGGSGERHVEWGTWADAILIAPATASVIGRLRAGLYDDPVTLTASMIPPERWFLAPAMAAEMWLQPAVRRNVAELAEWGARFLGPVDGPVASGGTGKRLLEPEAIASALVDALS